MHSSKYIKTSPEFSYLSFLKYYLALPDFNDITVQKIYACSWFNCSNFGWRIEQKTAVSDRINKKVIYLNVKAFVDEKIYLIVDHKDCAPEHSGQRLWKQSKPTLKKGSSTSSINVLFWF